MFSRIMVMSVVALGFGLCSGQAARSFSFSTLRPFSPTMSLALCRDPSTVKRRSMPLLSIPAAFIASVSTTKVRIGQCSNIVQPLSMTKTSSRRSLDMSFRLGSGFLVSLPILLASFASLFCFSFSSFLLLSQMLYGRYNTDAGGA
ncbi:hypothetical protein J3E74DRAFT_338849 [Bipolaris maydis]|nr:hypothetical protein J3E74DRAFT_397580 [Bipolaris maydis]KAJ5061249.1 hypothetical protein J3E74DRAFT_338849 [Bipolaris maydis]